MDRPNAELADWVADRMERVIWLTPADGDVFSLEPAVARRLLAYAGFSLYRDAQSLGMRGVGGVPSVAGWPRPVESAGMRRPSGGVGRVVVAPDRPASRRAGARETPSP